jgi:hypothetical protein
VCMSPGEKRLILQSPRPTMENALRDFPTERIKQELQQLNLEDTQWEWEIVGPRATLEQLVSQLEQASRFFKARGCIKLELPSTACPTAGGGECKKDPPHPGFAILQNLDVGKYPDNNGQSVVLVAPRSR